MSAVGLVTLAFVRRMDLLLQYILANALKHSFVLIFCMDFRTRNSLHLSSTRWIVMLLVEFLACTPLVNETASHSAISVAACFYHCTLSLYLYLLSVVLLVNQILSFYFATALDCSDTSTTSCSLLLSLCIRASLYPCSPALDR